MGGLATSLEDIVNRRIDNFFLYEQPSIHVITRSDLASLIKSLTAKIAELIRLTDPDLIELCESFDNDRQEAEDRLRKTYQDLENRESNHKKEISNFQINQVKSNNLIDSLKRQLSIATKFHDRVIKLENDIKIANCKIESLSKQLIDQRSKIFQLESELNDKNTVTMNKMIDKKI